MLTATLIFAILNVLFSIPRTIAQWKEFRAQMRRWRWDFHDWRNGDD